MSVFAEQIIEVAVQKTAVPHQLKQAVHHKPGVFHIAHLGAGLEQLAQIGLKAIEERVDQLVFGRVVVIQITL